MFFGGDTANTRANLTTPANINAPTQINPRTAPKLQLKWSYSTVGDVSATPTVEQGGLYVPDYAGYLYKLDPDTGALQWSHPLSDYTGQYGFSRGSPAIGALGEIVLGVNTVTSGVNAGANVLAINRADGTKKWQTVIDTNPHTFVTSSPVIYNKRVYVGVTSNEESLSATIPNFSPTFRGSVVALDEATGAVVWTFKTVPLGYAGGGVWGSNPVIFSPAKLVIVGTGNNIAIPASATSCQTAAGSDQAAQLACMDPSDYEDSIVALDMDTGALKWSRRTVADNWNVACLRGPASACPVPTGPDVDFSSMPNLVFLNNFIGTPDDRGGTSKSYFLGAGQKSSIYWGLNPYNGGLYWSRYIGAGQIVWGSAINMGVRTAVFAALENHQHLTNTLVGRGAGPITSQAGAWTSISLFTGAINWQVPTVGQDIVAPAYGGVATGPISYTNNVMFAGSTSGYLAALNANTGQVLWSYNTGGPVIGGVSIYNETVYSGAGNVRSGVGGVHTVFAFAVPPPT